MLFISLYTQINLLHVFKMSAFGTYACLQSCTPLVNGCVNVFFNAVPKVYLYN